jgi:hypothetical protein
MLYQYESRDATCRVSRVAREYVLLERDRARDKVYRSIELAAQHFIYFLANNADVQFKIFILTGRRAGARLT